VQERHFRLYSIRAANVIGATINGFELLAVKTTTARRPLTTTTVKTTVRKHQPTTTTTMTTTARMTTTTTTTTTTTPTTTVAAVVTETQKPELQAEELELEIVPEVEAGPPSVSERPWEPDAELEPEVEESEVAPKLETEPESEAGSEPESEMEMDSEPTPEPETDFDAPPDRQNSMQNDAAAVLGDEQRPTLRPTEHSTPLASVKTSESS
jgi:hypothetical protein